MAEYDQPLLVWERNAEKSLGITKIRGAIGSKIWRGKVILHKLDFLLPQKEETLMELFD